MTTYSVRRLRGCTDEPIYEVRFDDWDEAAKARLRSALDELGAVSQPLPGRPLVRMDEPAYVLTGNLAQGRLRLRCTSGDDVRPDRLRFRLEDQLDRAFDVE